MYEALTFDALRPAEGALGILYLGQAGFLFTAGHGVLCVDPYLSNCVEKLVGMEARRMWWNSFRADELRPGAVLVTHDHLDHLDPETLPVFEQVSPPDAYFGPDSALAHLRRLRFREPALRRLARGDAAGWGGMRLKAVYAEHTEDSIGVVLSTPALSVYITGDTCPRDALVNEDTMNCDVLIACINGIDENLNPEEAMDLAERLGAKLVIPMHYGLIPCSTVPLVRFATAAVRTGIRGLPMVPETAWIVKKTSIGVEAAKAVCGEEKR
jgi:L-ascorbate metabolism protein UlaG (beta-lactamase superfamily)